MPDRKNKNHFQFNAFSGADIEVWCVIKPPTLGEIQDYISKDVAADKYAQSQRDLDIAESELERVIQNQKVSDSEYEQATDNFNAALKANLEAHNQSITTYPTAKLYYKKLAECSSISYSVFREKKLVRGIGQANIKGLTSGPRTIAGSLIFTVFDKAVMHELLESVSSNGDPRTILVDQLPAMDIFIFLANEYGSVSRIAIYGVEFMNEGQVMSINDMFIENQVNYIARDIDTMILIDDLKPAGLTFPTLRNVDSIMSATYTNTRATIRLGRIG